MPCGRSNGIQVDNRTPIVKQGLLKKFLKSHYTRGTDRDRKTFVALHEDGQFVWYPDQFSQTADGYVHLPSVKEYIAVGPYTRDIPGRPPLPPGATDRHLLAVSETPSKRSAVHWFICDNDAELGSWMDAICHTLTKHKQHPQKDERRRHDKDRDQRHQPHQQQRRDGERVAQAIMHGHPQLAGGRVPGHAHNHQKTRSSSSSPSSSSAPSTATASAAAVGRGKASSRRHRPTGGEGDNAGRLALDQRRQKHQPTNGQPPHRVQPFPLITDTYSQPGRPAAAAGGMPSSRRHKDTDASNSGVLFPANHGRRQQDVDDDYGQNHSHRVLPHPAQLVSDTHGHREKLRASSSEALAVNGSPQSSSRRHKRHDSGRTDDAGLTARGARKEPQKINGYAHPQVHGSLPMYLTADNYNYPAASQPSPSAAAVAEAAKPSSRRHHGTDGGAYEQHQHHRHRHNDMGVLPEVHRKHHHHHHQQPTSSSHGPPQPQSQPQPQRPKPPQFMTDLVLREALRNQPRWAYGYGPAWGNSGWGLYEFSGWDGKAAGNQVDAATTTARTRRDGGADDRPSTDRRRRDKYSGGTARDSEKRHHHRHYHHHNDHHRHVDDYRRDTAASRGVIDDWHSTTNTTTRHHGRNTTRE